ncbi:hypothetical protein BDZ89DRAFT_1071978 [Hymenopellis radicata]|nr:hypothetical protein BDZ89DRAFT_1071978 [Hymenopellis radicata]
MGEPAIDRGEVGMELGRSGCLWCMVSQILREGLRKAVDTNWLMINSILKGVQTNAGRLLRTRYAPKTFQSQCPLIQQPPGDFMNGSSASNSACPSLGAGISILDAKSESKRWRSNQLLGVKFKHSCSTPRSYSALAHVAARLKLV